MRYLWNRLGFDEIRLSATEKRHLQKEIKEIDFKRINFFAFIAFFSSTLFLILDIFLYNDQYQKYYIILDFSLMLVSLIVVINSFVKHDQTTNTWKNTINRIFPAIMLTWATGIATLNPDSVLNMTTFYIVVFLIAFVLIIPIRIFLLYLIFAISVYGTINFLIDRAFFTETFALICAIGIIVLPFYQSSYLSRINSQAALIKVNNSNKTLEDDLSKTVKKLKQLNEDLGNENTHRKIIEDRLKEALKKVESSDKLKSEFLANISHEIRTPLNAIIGFTEMMTEDGVNEEKKQEFQKIVSSNTMYLLSTFDDIFDASHVKTKQFKPVNKDFFVNQFLDNLMYEANGAALKYNRTNIEFKIIKLKNDAIINTDDFLLKKALLRIIDNSFKFTSEGSITVGASKFKNDLVLFVEDTGIGIEKKNYDKIFEAFFQSDGSFSRTYGGSGLGLTIVKGIVEVLNCDFSFKSVKEKGSKFTIKIRTDI